MKVVIITNGLFPVPATKGGGAETLVQNILDQNEIYHKIEFLVYSIYEESAVEAASNYHYSKFKFIKKKKWGIEDTFHLIKHAFYKKILGYTIYRCIYDFDIVLDELEKEKFDYIVIENTLVPFKKFVQRYSNQVFVHIHNELFKPTCPNIQKKEYGRLINQSAGIITVSDYIKEYSLGIGTADESKLHVLLNAVDIKKYKNKLECYDERYNDLRNKFVFVFFGRICDDKGVLELLNAFSKIEDEDVRLMIIGSLDNEKDEYIKNVRMRVKRDNRVIVTGYVNHDEIWKYLKMSGCATLPSKCQDACPLTIIESMASGLPIISTRTGGVPEEVDDECAILLENDNQLEENLLVAMLKIYSDPLLREKMSKASEKRTQINGFFDLKNYYDRFVNILEGID